MRGQCEGVKGGLTGDSGGGVKVNVTGAREERGVFDLTNSRTKTLQPTVFVLYPTKRLGAFPAAACEGLRFRTHWTPHIVLTIRPV